MIKEQPNFDKEQTGESSGMEEIAYDRQVRKGGPFRAGQGKKIGEKMIGSTGSKSGFKYDSEDIENVPVVDVEGNEIGEDHIIDLIAVREEQEDQKRKKIEKEKTLSEGRAYVIKKPVEEKEELEISLDKGTRNFETGGQLIDFLEKRDIARDRARQKYAEEQEKKQK